MKLANALQEHINIKKYNPLKKAVGLHALIYQRVQQNLRLEIFHSRCLQYQFIFLSCLFLFITDH